eukprot:TRINITY_DN430_c3_g2_i2.p1 TRINITY_DN430_c3_g2~~TRINITY_DN430_c3_g2_i2.p1  ORF type:complete len:373 (-),score=140.71 TRINITY_DN430_c3_g2_i2:4803-5810(-)
MDLLEDPNEGGFTNLLLKQATSEAQSAASPASALQQRASRATRLLDKRNETLQVQGQLEAHKQQAQRHEQQLAQRELELRNKQAELHDSLLKFNKFLTDNDAKRSEAERKLVDNKKFLDQKDEEISQLRRMLEQLRADEQDKRRLLERHTKYQKFFESVLEKSDDYKEVKGLIERWMTLNKTQLTLQADAEAAGKRSEQHKAALQKYLADKANDVLAVNNTIAELQQQLESQLERSLQEEAVRDERAEQQVGKTLEYTQIRMAVENVYRRVCERCGQKFKKTSMFRQLDFVGAVMVDYQDIYNKGKRRLAAPDTARSGGTLQPSSSASGGAAAGV